MRSPRATIIIGIAAPAILTVLARTALYTIIAALEACIRLYED
jgi:hypothetical protein